MRLAEPLEVGKGSIRHIGTGHYAAAAPNYAGVGVTYFTDLNAFTDVSFDGEIKIADISTDFGMAPYEVRNMADLSGWAVDFDGDSAPDPGLTPDIVTVLLGTNDVDLGKPLASTKSNINDIIDLAQTHIGAKAVFLGTVIEFAPLVVGDAQDDLVDAINDHIALKEDLSGLTKVIIADQFSGEVGPESSAPSNKLVSADYFDAKHPFTISGSKKLARNWLIPIMKEIYSDQYKYNFLVGDITGPGGIPNGIVEFDDFLVVSGNTGTNVDKYEDGDLDGDGYVSFADFLIISANYNKTLADFAP